MAYNYDPIAAAVPGGGVEAYLSSALIFPSQCRCDYGHCDQPVTAVVMVTSGTVAVEVRASCEHHVDRMHAGWSNKQVAIVRVNQPRA